MAKTYSLIPDCCLGANIADPYMKMLLIELYAMANFGDTVELRRGQLSTTYHEICHRTALTLKQVRTRIDSLVKSRQLLKQKTNQGIVLTIVNYDKNIRGKGRHKKDATICVSTDYTNYNSQKGNQGADSRADFETYPSICQSKIFDDYSIEKGIQNGMQNEKNDAHYITIRDKREVVVKKEGNSNNDIIRQKKLDFKNKALSFIDNLGWKQHLEIPAFKDSVKKYLEYYGACKDGNTLCYETIKGFTIDGSLHKWIRNENSLKNNM